jgi:hypothetical protein
MIFISQQEKNYINILKSEDTPEDTRNDPSCRDAISHLVLALQRHPVSKRLRSVPSRRPVNRELALIYGRLDSDDFDLSAFNILTALIADEGDNVEVWTTVLQLMSSPERLLHNLEASRPPFTEHLSYTRRPRSKILTRLGAIFSKPLLIELSGNTFGSSLSNLRKGYGHRR